MPLQSPTDRPTHRHRNVQWVSVTDALILPFLLLVSSGHRASERDYSRLHRPLHAANDDWPAARLHSRIMEGSRVGLVGLVQTLGMVKCAIG